VSAELYLARRYLVGLRRRTHVATVSAISLVSLSLGVLALIVTLSLLEGFQSTIRGELIKRTAHARLTPAEGRRLEAPAELVSILQRKLPGVHVVQVVHATCLVGPAGDAVPALVEGRSGMRGAVADSVLAARLGLAPGDTVDVISPRRRLTPLGPVPVRMRVTVTAVKPPAPGREGGALLLPLAEAQRLLWGKPAVEAIELRDAAHPWELAGRVRRALGDRAKTLRIEGLRELHHPLLLALSLERAMLFLAVGLMLIVAALNLLCNIAMVAAEKRTDLAVLSGLGVGPRALRRLFLFLGLGIGVVGSFSGAAAGTVLAVVLNRTHAIPLPRGVFIVSSVPFKVQPGMVAAVVGLALALSLVAAWLPSRTVSLRDPAEGLRYE